MRGVGIMMAPRMADTVKGYMAVSDIILIVKFIGKRLDMIIKCIYTLTAECQDETIEEF